jgi:plasmid stability protein
MRTTITLDPDVYAELRRLARERGQSLKEVVNAVLRRGLASGEGEPRPYRLATRPLRLRPGIDLDKALRLAAELEDAETIRTHELRK